MKFDKYLALGIFILLLWLGGIFTLVGIMAVAIWRSIQ